MRDVGIGLIGTGFMGKAHALAFGADALACLPPATATDPGSVLRRHRDKEVLRAELARLAADDATIAAALDAAVDAVNADPEGEGWFAKIRAFAAA